MVALITLSSGCTTVTLERGDVAGVARGAFGSAGIEVDDITVADAMGDGSWPVTAVVDDTSFALVVDGRSGRVTSIDLGDSELVSTEQLRRIGSYASNPSDERAQRRRTVVVLAIVFGGISGGLLVARRLRLREEAALAARNDTDET